MPIYVLNCKVCGKTFEAFSSVEERHEQRCSCGGKSDVVITPFFSTRTETVTIPVREWRGTPDQKLELARQRRLNKTPGWSKRGAGSIKPFWHEDLGAKPVYITSKRQLTQELRKRGLYNSKIGVHPRGENPADCGKNLD